MRRSALRVVVVLAVLSALGPAPVLAADDEGFTLPERPQPLTRAQYTVLQKLAKEPQHAAISLLRATYRDKATQIATDGGQIAFLTGLGGGILTILICAAPL